MKGSLHIPPFVNYSCQLCGWCCHQYDISFSRNDFERLSKHDWGALESSLAGKEWCAPLRGAGRRSDAGNRSAFRLRYAPDGACVFLSPDNKCMMHKHVGELGKTLGCCVFPFSFAATPDGVYVGGRFSCRAMAYGLGEPLIRRAEPLKKQLALCEKGRHVPQYPDEVIFDGRHTLPWADYMRLEEALIRVFLRGDLPLVRRLFMASKFMELLSGARLERVRGPKFAELIRILEDGLVNEALKEDLAGPVRGIANVLFRQFCSLFQRRQGGAYRELSALRKLRVRLDQFWRGVEFALGAGSPLLPAFDDRVSLSAMRRTSMLSADPLGHDAEFAFSRFLAAKLFGKQYFGKLFFDYSVLQGLNFLILAAGAVMWYARARALSRGAAALETEDVIEAIRYVDFCYGYSAAPAPALERLRVRVLGRGDTAIRLALAQFPATDEPAGVNP